MWKRRLASPWVIFTFIIPLTPCCGRADQPLAADAAALVAESGTADRVPAVAPDAAQDASVSSSGTDSALNTAPDTRSATGTATESTTATATATGSVTDASTASATATDSSTSTSGSGTGTSTATNRCEAPGLVWKTANKTEFTSYPAPGSEECIKYSGCLYEGMFAGCGPTMPQSWVQSHDIVSVFPDFATLKHHDLCLKSGSKTMVVLVIDTCADSDCSGCCTQNKGSANELIDIESYTAARFGVSDGPIQWADLGTTKGDDCPP
jgi:hypothetical protein